MTGWERVGEECKEYLVGMLGDWRTEELLTEYLNHCLFALLRGFALCNSDWP